MARPGEGPSFWRGVSACELNLAPVYGETAVIEHYFLTRGNFNFSFYSFLNNLHAIKISEDVFLVVLPSKYVDVRTCKCRRVAVSSDGDISLLLAFKPPEHLFLTSLDLQIISVAHGSIRVESDGALNRVSLRVQP